MAAEIVELIDSRSGADDLVSGKASEDTLHFLVYGTADDTEVVEKALEIAPTTYHSLIRHGIRREPRWVDTENSDGQWDVYVTYGQRDLQDQTGQASFSFDTTGGIQHVTVSRATMFRTSKDEEGHPAPNYMRLIGWNGEEAEGVDITVPKLAFSLKRKIPKTTWSAAYFGTLYDLTGHMNEDEFTVTINGTTYTFEAGEVLFLGATGDDALDALFVEVTYHFTASRNKEFGEDEIEGFPAFSKRGQDYMWIHYSRVEDEVSGTVVGRPDAIYVERVYEYGTFADLEPSEPS